MIPRPDLLSVKRIASKDNPRVKTWSSLSDKKGREASGLTLAEGALLSREGLDPILNPQSGPESGRLRPAVLLVSDAGAAHPLAGEIFDMAGAAGVERVSLSDPCFAKISAQKTPDGLALVLAVAGEEAPETILKRGEKWLVADEVQDPGNAGALVRTALAAGWDGCVFLGGVDPLSPKFIRGSMGAVYRIPCLGISREGFLEAWAGFGGRLFLADSGGGGKSFRDVSYDDRLALAIGGEKGISPQIAGLAAERIHIPLRGSVESLNLAVAAGIILFEAGRGGR